MPAAKLVVAFASCALAAVLGGCPLVEDARLTTQCRDQMTRVERLYQDPRFAEQGYVLPDFDAIIEFGSTLRFKLLDSPACRELKTKVAEMRDIRASMGQGASAARQATTRAPTHGSSSAVGSTAEDPMVQRAAARARAATGTVDPDQVDFGYGAAADPAGTLRRTQDKLDRASAAHQNRLRRAEAVEE